MSSAQRANVIKGLTPGSTLHMDGHVMLYLGSSNEIPYAIHLWAAIIRAVRVIV